MAAAIGLALGSLPMLAAAGGGRWDLPTQDFGTSLSLAPQPSFRILWVGDPRGLPLGSWQLEGGVGYATSTDGPPDAAYLWPPHRAGATALLAGDLHLATARLTTRLGHLLAPMAVRYVVIPIQSAPTGAGGSAVTVPEEVLAALDQQTDLKAQRVDDALRVYENAAWVPGRALLSPEVAAQAMGATGPAASQAAELAGSAGVLNSGGRDSFTGPLPADSHVLVSASGRGGWHLSVAGQGATRQPAFGWAMAFATGPAGNGTLHFVPSLAGQGLKVLEVGLWLAAVAALVTDRNRRRRDRGAIGERATSSVAAPPPPLLGAAPHRRPRRVTVPDTGDDDEMWT
jgi:hypothetical protein